MTVTDTLKDAAYVVIGFGVLSFQRAQVRRQELRKQLRDSRKSVVALAGQLDGYVAPVRLQLESRLDSVEETLPPAVQDLVKQARATLVSQEKAVRARLGLTAA